MALAVVGVVAAASGFVLLTPWGCDALGFKWGSAKSICVTPACYWFESCGEWAYPSHRCARLAPGDSLAKMYFELGNPKTINASEAQYEMGKADPATFRVVLSGNRVKRVDCP